jgi:hypothetical protein
MRFILSVLLIFGIFAGLSSAFWGPRYGYGGWYGGRGWYGHGYYGAPCGGWYWQPGPAPQGAPPQGTPPAAPGSAPNATPNSSPGAIAR